jgi:hypothetical protein
VNPKSGLKHTNNLEESKMINIKTFEGFLDFFSEEESEKSVRSEVLDKLISGKSVTITEEEIPSYKFKVQLRSDGSGVALSDLPELKGLEFNYQKSGPISKRFYVLQKIK